MGSRGRQKAMQRNISFVLRKKKKELKLNSTRKEASMAAYRNAIPLPNKKNSFYSAYTKQLDDTHALYYLLQWENS